MSIGIACIIIGIIVLVIGPIFVNYHRELVAASGVVMVVVGILVIGVAYIKGRNHISEGELKQLRRNTADSYPQLTIDSVNAFSDGTGRAQVTLSNSQCVYVIDVVTGDQGLILVQGTATSPSNEVFIQGNFAKNTSEECAVDPFTSQ